MAKPENRRYRRISLSLPAQITVNTIDDAEGKLINISPGGLAVQSDASVVVGDAVSVRIASLDVIEGTVARLLPDGFAVSFLLPKKRRAVLTEKLMLLANAQYSEGLGDRRATPRHRDSHSRTACRLDDGSSLYVKIVNVSVNGMALEAPRRPPIGAGIHVGRRPGVVVRHTSSGFVVIYDEAKAKPAAKAKAKPLLKAV